MPQVWFVNLGLGFFNATRGRAFNSETPLGGPSLAGLARVGAAFC